MRFASAWSLKVGTTFLCFWGVVTVDEGDKIKMKP